MAAQRPHDFPHQSGIDSPRTPDPVRFRNSDTLSDLGSWYSPRRQTVFAQAPSGPLAQQVGTDPARLFLSDVHTDVVALADPSGSS